MSDRATGGAQPRWRRYIRFWGKDVDADIDDELRYHIEMRTRDFIERGLSSDAARDAAVALFGDERVVAKELREHDTRLLRQARRADMLQDLGQDLRYAMRQLRNAPRFTLAVVAVLALGIGANAAIFSTIDAAFLRPLPFANPHELVSLSAATIDLPFEAAMGRPQTMTSLDDVRADSSAFAGVAAYASGGLNFTGGVDPERASIAYVSRDFFATLGRAAAIGRVPVPSEYEKGNTNVIVVSRGLWERELGGDRAAIGRRVQMNGVSYTVVGVMPADFHFPAGADVWMPLALPFGFDIMSAFRNFVPAQFVARLAPHVSVAQAAQHLDVMRRRFPGWDKRAPLPVSSLARPLQTALVGDRRTALLVLMTSAALLLIIACANVTNLLLARASVRQREVAVRVVLGATRGRVVRQMIVESVVLALAGGVAAIVVARAGLGALSNALPPALGAIAPPRIDFRVFTFALLLATLTSFLFGLWPALGASRPNLSDAVKAGGGLSGTASRHGAGARNTLVVAEVSLALMLLVGAGLMLQSLRALLEIDTGMKTEHVVTARLVLSGVRYPRQAKAVFIDAVIARLRATPGITDAASVSLLPMEASLGISVRIAPEDAPSDSTRWAMGAYLMATPGYFSVMGAALRGADLPAVADTSRRVAVINKSMADQLWPGQNAVGRRLLFGSQARTVVGVVADVRNVRLDMAAATQMYFPMSEQPQSYAAIVARGPGDAEAMEHQLVSAVRAVDPMQPLYEIRKDGRCHRRVGGAASDEYAPAHGVRRIGGAARRRGRIWRRVLQRGAADARDRRARRDRRPTGGRAPVDRWAGCAARGRWHRHRRGRRVRAIENTREHSL